MAKLYVIFFAGMLDFSTMTRPWLSLAISVLLIGTNVSASAQEAGGTDEISEARALFIAGRSAFNEGRYDAALDYFQRSYTLSGKSVLLFNVAQCYDRLRRDDEALTTFEKYLQEVPEAENRAEVESRIGILKAAIANRQQAPASDMEGDVGQPPPELAAAPSEEGQPADGTVQAVEEDSTPSKKSSSFPFGPVITMGAGGVTGIVGLVIMAGAKGKASDIENVQPGAKTASQLESDRKAAKGQWVAGQVILGVGLAAAVGGLVWFLLDGDKETATNVGFQLQPSGLGVAGRF